MEMHERLAEEFSLRPEYVKNIIALIDEGNTIPFIARYRKEQTGSCDDQVLRKLEERLGYLRELEARRAFVRQAVIEQGKAEPAWLERLEGAQTMAQVEDLYLPFRPKRRTRGAIAREKGLGPLAQALLDQPAQGPKPETLAAGYLSPQGGVASVDEALDGALDIAAEEISDRADLRGALRQKMMEQGILVSRSKGEPDPIYQLYGQFSAPVKRIAGYQILAINRGEKEGKLSVSIELAPLAVMAIMERQVIVGRGPYAAWVRSAAEAAYTRLLQPSLERETRSTLTEQANQQAIGVFAANLKPLLLQPPLRGKAVLGFDPGYRTGCKVAVVDATGKVMETTAVYPTPPHNRQQQAEQIVCGLIERYQVEAVAIGNGTASREAESFIAGLLPKLDRPVAYMVVSEAGASVYSASPLGAAEFPELDVSVRSAVSIARRLQDALAELVKIDPKALGVGQYQHDMPPKQLKQALEAVVEDCVNAVGVDVNRASAALLGYVSGLNKTTAANLVAYREANGPFASRNELKKVPRLGDKAYEQCAGFLRIPDARDVLDRTGVHPESYAKVRRMMQTLKLRHLDPGTIRIQAEEYGLQALAEACGLGLPTLQDIIAELSKPGRDPRDELPPPMLRTDIMHMEDLAPGMKVKGTVRNVTDFGVFVDIGVHQDGLVHRSKLGAAGRRLAVGQIVTVQVLQVDLERKRIALSLAGE